MNISIPLITKTKSIAFVFTFISIIVFLYFLMEPYRGIEEDVKLHLTVYIHILSSLLVLVTSLLLYQATLDLNGPSRYWPTPKHCLWLWTVVHLIVLLILFSDIVYCFNSFSNQNFPLMTMNTQKTNSKDNYIKLILCLIIGQIVILLGVKVVITLFEECNNDEG